METEKRRRGRPPKSSYAASPAHASTSSAAPSAAPPSHTSAATTARTRGRPPAVAAASTQPTGLGGVVVLEYPPHPWSAAARWAPGFRRGEIAWTEVVHPIVRPHPEAYTGPNEGKLLWPVEIVDRWISNPSRPIDPRLQLVKAATDQTANGITMGFDAKFSPDPALAAKPTDTKSAVSATVPASLDLLDTFARLEYKQILETRRREAVEPGVVEQTQQPEGEDMAVDVDDSFPAARPAIPKPRVEIPFGITSGSGRQSVNASGATSPYSSADDVSDVEDRSSSSSSSNGDIASVTTSHTGNKPATIQFAPPIKPIRPIVIPQPVRRGRGRGSFKTLMNAHVRLQDPTGVMQKRKRELEESVEGVGDVGSGMEESEADEMGGGGGGGNGFFGEGLQVHYLVRPLPLPTGREVLNIDGTVPPARVEEEREGVTKGCLYRTGEQVLPFAMYNPDCREDVLWNVAAMQAMDIAGSWGVPKHADQNVTDPDESGVWGSIVSAMNLPPRPDEAALPSDQTPSSADPATPAQTSSTTTPPTATATTTPASVAAAPHLLKPLSLKPVSNRRGSLPDVWGLDRDTHSVQGLLHHVRSSTWCGNDSVDAVLLAEGGGSGFAGPTAGSRLLRRFRLGSEVIQVGDLVR
ncbi:hypothetical protein HDU98_004688, partial [Podochytrium sp. JEL0797]